MRSAIFKRCKKALGAVAAGALITGVTTFLGSPLAHAGTVPAPGTGYTSQGASKFGILPTANGSQLGLYYIQHYRHPHSTYYPFMNLKFSQGALTIYYVGFPNSSNTCQDASEPTAGCVGQDVGSGNVNINIMASSGGSSVPVQYSYNVPSNFTSANPGTVNTYTIPLTEAAAGYNITGFSIQYYGGYLLHSYGQNTTAFRGDQDTFNSAMDLGTTVVQADGRESQTSPLTTYSSINYFNVDSNGNAYEVTPSDESLTFKNGAVINFYPASGIFDIQRGSGSTEAGVKVISTSGSEVSNLSLNDTSFNNAFNLGDKVEIFATSSNPITSEASLPPSGSGDSAVTLSSSQLSKEGWNLTGDNILINRDDAVKLYWTPSSANLPTYRYMLFKYLGDENFNTLRTQYPAFFDWLWKSPEALNEFLTSGYASQSSIGPMRAYLWDVRLSNSYNSTTNILDTESPSAELRALEIWGKIWREYPASETGEDLKIAVATSLDFASNVLGDISGKPIDPVGRYEIYAQAYADNTLISNFSDYSAQTLRDVVDDRISNASLKYLRSYILGHEPMFFTWPVMTNLGYYLLRYTPYSPYTDVFSGGFLGPDASIWNIMRYAGVCGTNSNFSLFLLNALGEAGYATGEPSHCAYIYLYQGNWYLGFADSGWAGTEFGPSAIPLTLAGTQLNANPYSKNQSYLLTFEAESDMSQGRYAEALSNLKQAVSIAPANITAWQQYVQAANHLKETSGLAAKIQTTFNSLYKKAPYQPFAEFNNNNLPYGYSLISYSLTSKIKS